MGRLRTYTAEIAEVVCEKLKQGLGLQTICNNDPTLPAASTIRQWVYDDVDGFAAKYACARDLGLDALAEECLAIADDTSRDTVATEGGDRPDSEWIARSRLRFDARRWYLSKIAPKRYGDKLDVTSDGEKLPGATLILRDLRDTPKSDGE